MNDDHKSLHCAKVTGENAITAASDRSVPIKQDGQEERLIGNYILNHWRHFKRNSYIIIMSIHCVTPYNIHQRVQHGLHLNGLGVTQFAPGWFLRVSRAILTPVHPTEKKSGELNGSCLYLKVMLSHDSTTTVGHFRSCDVLHWLLAGYLHNQVIPEWFESANPLD